jgi:lipooligosaccharide transport system permease protein
MTSLALTVRPLEFFLAQYRRIWRATIVSSVVTPIVYLLALGVGMGAFIGDVSFRGQTYEYFEFVAPGLLAATAMQVASFEATWPVLSAIKWTRQYHAMLATPLGIRHIVLAHQGFIASRMLLTATVYLAVISAFGAVRSPLAVFAIPVAALVGLSYSAPIAAWSAHAENEASFVAIFRFVILPMFLFSGTFFPITELPAPLELIAYVTPLWHGVDLCRQLVLGDVVSWIALVHALYLVACVGVGLALALFTYRRRLVV